MYTYSFRYLNNNTETNKTNTKGRADKIVGGGGSETLFNTAISKVTPSGKQNYSRLKERSIKAELQGFFRD